MFVATTAADYSKLRRSGMNEDLAPRHRAVGGKHEDMSLLRSCSTRVARVAIYMALLPELLAALATILRCVKYACKVPASRGALHTLREQLAWLSCGGVTQPD